MAINKIIFGDTPIIDLTNDSVTTDKVVNGKSFMGRNGIVQTGTMVLGGATVNVPNISIVGKTYQYPSWSTGIDAEIIDILEKHYRGQIDIRTIWNERDVREFVLSDGVVVKYELVYADILGELLLTNPTAYRKHIAFLLRPLYISYNSSKGSNTWSVSTIRNFCNTIYYDKFSDTSKNIFRQFQMVANVDDYFCIPASGAGVKTNAAGTGVPYYIRASNAYVRADGVAVSSTNITLARGVYPYGAI